LIMKEDNLPFKLAGLTKGTVLPEIKRTISQENINLFAEATRDFNPIHVDDNFARKTPFQGTIAHGMLVLAYVSQIMTAAFGRKWFDSSQLDVRLKTPVRPGDILTFGGIIRDINMNQEETLVLCDVFCRNQKGEPVIIGSARVKV